MKIRRSARVYGALSVLGALSIVGLLAGCSPQQKEDEPAAMPFDTVVLPEQTAPAATPGQRLEVGEIALLPRTDFRGTPVDPIETTVIGIAEGDASYWDGFDNGAEFAGQTPFFAVMQYRWVTGSVSAYDTPYLRPVLADGSPGGTVQREYAGSMTANTACPFDIGRFDLDETRGPEEYIACVVYTAPAGSQVTGLAWHNDASASSPETDPALNPFAQAPAVWDIVPLALTSGS